MRRSPSQALQKMGSGIPSAQQKRSSSQSAHLEYLNRLQPPSRTESEHILQVQLQHEEEVLRNYYDTEAQHAATKIQSAYRGHRARRQLNGHTLDPSERWSEAIRELRYRAATAPHYSAASVIRQGPKISRLETAKLNWKRATRIAEHAGGGELSPSPIVPDMHDPGHSASPSDSSSESIEETLLLDQRYFLEMVDRKHRYGANLQVFHEYWSREKTEQNFFYWLDHDAGRHMNLPGCSREKLDKERIRYLTKEERLFYLVQIDDDGRLRWAKNDELITTDGGLFMDSSHGIVKKAVEEPQSHISTPGDPSIDDASVSSFSDDDDDEEDDGSSTKIHPNNVKSKRRFRLSPATIFNHLLRATVKPGTWIYVADTVGRVYISIKSSGTFQHASFLSGARISSAGSVGVRDGQLVSLSPLSGHYRPTTKSFRNFLTGLRNKGVDMSQLHVSQAYQVLQGMETYNRTVKKLHNVVSSGKHAR